MEDELAARRRSASALSAAGHPFAPGVMRRCSGRSGPAFEVIPAVIDCPLGREGCAWTGPVLEVRSHLGEAHGRRYDQG